MSRRPTAGVRRVVLARAATLARTATLALVAALAASPAFAQAPLATAEVRLGRAAVRARITVSATSEGGARLELAPRDGAPTTLGIQGASTAPLRWATVRVVEIARGVRAAVVLAAPAAPEPAGALPERGHAAVIGLADGHPAVVAEGGLGLAGDLGERTSFALAIDDFTGDGLADVVVGTRREGVRLCGATRLPMLAPRALDPATLALRPVALSPLRELAGREDGVTARDAWPGATGPPVARVLTWESASTHARRAGGPHVPPNELGDGRRDTWWAAAGGRFAFVTARVATGAGALRALALTLTPSDAAAARGLRRPRTLWLSLDSGERLRVTLPGDALLRPDGRYWIVPPGPLATRCLSLVLDDSYGDTAARDVAIAEVEAYTELDQGPGLERLAGRLEEPGHASAVETLGRAGLRGLEVVAARWPRMGETGRTRALDVVERVLDAARGQPDEAELGVRAGALLALAFADPSPVVAGRSFEPLARLDATAAALVTAALGGEDEERALRALEVLARAETDAAVPLLIAGLGDPRAPLRAAAARASVAFVRRALRPGSTRAAQTEPLLRVLATGAVPADGAARVLAELGRHATLRDEVARAVASSWTRASDFETRLRLVRAAARVLEAPDARALLRAAADRGEPWPLRAVAVEALGRAPDVEQDTELLTRHLSDGAVRVRAAAVRALGPHAWAEGSIARVAGNDRWPLVRATAAVALGRSGLGPEGGGALARAVDDPAWLVRAAAIRALGATEVHAADARVLARLRDAREPAEVRRAAVDLAETRCWVAARAALLAVVRERPETGSDEWTSLATAAWRALVRLGPSSELREAAGFERGLPRRIQEEGRRLRRCR